MGSGGKDVRPPDGRAMSSFLTAGRLKWALLGHKTSLLAHGVRQDLEHPLVLEESGFGAKRKSPTQLWQLAA
jgi:hypothetical protein